MIFSILIVSISYRSSETAQALLPIGQAGAGAARENTLSGNYASRQLLYYGWCRVVRSPKVVFQGWWHRITRHVRRVVNPPLDICSFLSSPPPAYSTLSATLSDGFPHQQPAFRPEHVDSRRTLCHLQLDESIGVGSTTICYTAASLQSLLMARG